MSSFLEKIKIKAKSDPKRIVFPESTEERTLKAIEILLNENICKPVLIGDSVIIKKTINKLKLNIDEEKITIIDHLNSKNNSAYKKYSSEFFELRKHKGITIKDANKFMKNKSYYATMMVHLNAADGLVSGAIHSTADTIRPALQIIKTTKEHHKVSGLFFLIFEKRVVLFADAAVIIDPDDNTLSDIAVDSAKTAIKFGIKPKVAMLSFSTKGSAKHPFVDKVISATKLAKQKAKKIGLNAIIDGELQLDAALQPWVAKIKCPSCPIQGDANVLIFPDLESANIGYKLATFFGKAEAIGPILQGLKKPINDLSRSCTVKDIVDVVTLTVIEAQ